MSAEPAKTSSPTRQAWAAFSEEFADIGKRFREDYEKVSDEAAMGSEKSQKSLERAVKAVRGAVSGTARTIGESLRDPKIREETEEAGSALLRAVGVTLSELGERLQQDADEEKETASS